MITKKKFGTYDGREVFEYTLTDDISVSVLNFGATVTSVTVPSQNGETDVVLGFRSVDDQITKGDYMGAVAGRCANRIEDGKFVLNGKEYGLACNNGTNHLHGGNAGFDKKIYVAEEDGNSLKLTYVSADGEEGYPGEVRFTVVYTVKGGALSIEYFAESSEDTLFNVTNHAYFNLNGENDGNIEDNVLQIFADRFTPVKQNLIPTGELRSVKGTAFDFLQPKPIGKDINADDEQLRFAGGYDHNFCLNGSHAARAFSVKTGVTMDVYTDRPGVQFYSGNFLTGNAGKSVYNKRAGFCLETQFYPDAVNHANFDGPVLKKGERFYSKTEYVFSLKKTV